MTRLGVMMFLEYVIWGSWLPLLALYLGDFLKFTGRETGWIFATQAIASVVALFVSGQIADRYFSTERFLAASHLVGGMAMLDSLGPGLRQFHIAGGITHHIGVPDDVHLQRGILFEQLDNFGECGPGFGLQI